MRIRHAKGFNPYAFKKETEELISLDELRQAARYASDSTLEEIHQPLNDTLKTYDITTPLRIAHWLRRPDQPPDPLQTSISNQLIYGKERRQDFKGSHLSG